MERSRPRVLAAIAALGSALVIAPAAHAQSTDTTPPALGVATLPVCSVQRAAPGTVGSTACADGNWYTSTAGTPPHASVMITMTATDDVGVAKFQYSTDNGATWTDVPVTPGTSVTAQVEDTLQGATTFRYRAVDTSGNVSQDGATSNVSGGLNQAAAAGATAVRLGSTNGRAVGDKLVIDTGANQEVAYIASIPSPAPASPNPNVTLTAPLTLAHAAGVAVTATPAYRTISVSLDTQPPSATLPASVVNYHVGHSAAALVPTRTDPTPGSGGVAAFETYVDGVYNYSLPLDVSSLSLGRHTWSLRVGDNAGLGSVVTWTFMVTTSLTDIDNMITRYGTAGTIAAADATTLHATIANAKAADTAGDKIGAIASLMTFQGQVDSLVSNSAAHDLLYYDAADVIRQERGLPGPTESGLGAVTTPSTGAPRHPQLVPMASGTSNPGAPWKVLVIANNCTYNVTTGQCPGDYRHESIEDGEVIIQKLGQQLGFNVDIWDKAYPSLSTPDTPFTSAADLSQYKVIIGDSSVGNNTLVTNWRMKDGTTVNEQAAFQGFIENGGGYVAIHGADDSLHNWQYYKDAMGGLFVNHPGNSGNIGRDCSTCYLAEVDTEDNSNPATKSLPAKFPVLDELYQFDRHPRPFIHPLLLLNESTYVTGMGVTNGVNASEKGDHPIAWCRSYDGGRWFTQVLGHNWELFTNTAWYQQFLAQGILWAAGQTQANCVTHTDVKAAIAAAQTAGTLTSDAATAASADVDSAYTKYTTLTKSGYTSSLSDIDALHTTLSDPASGDADARAKLLALTQQLKDWMLVLLGATSQTQTTAATVPATLSLSTGPAAAFGAFAPGVAQTYNASTTANVISTAGDATLTVSDPSATATGHLVNGTFSLPGALMAKAASPLGAGGVFAPVGSSSSPLQLLMYSGPVSNDAVTLSFQQAIGSTDALRTGSYSKTLTFTLSTTTP